MATKKLIPLDISESPDLSRLAEEVERSGIGRLLRRGDRPVAILQPLLKDESKPIHEERGYRPEDDSLLGIIGMFDSGEQTDIARHKDRYIADAIEHREE